MSRLRSIYVVSMLSAFHFHLHENRHTCSFAYVLEYALLSLDDNVDEECE